MAFVRKIFADNAGHAAVEYSLVLAFLVIGIISTISFLGTSVSGSFTNTSQQIQLATAN